MLRESRVAYIRCFASGIEASRAIGHMLCHPFLPIFTPLIRWRRFRRCSGLYRCRCRRVCATPCATRTTPTRSPRTSVLSLHRFCRTGNHSDGFDETVRLNYGGLQGRRCECSTAASGPHYTHTHTHTHTHTYIHEHGRCDVSTYWQVFIVHTETCAHTGDRRLTCACIARASSCPSRPPSVAARR